MADYTQEAVELRNTLLKALLTNSQMAVDFANLLGRRSATWIFTKDYCALPSSAPMLPQTSHREQQGCQ